MALEPVFRPHEVWIGVECKFVAYKNLKKTLLPGTVLSLLLILYWPWCQVGTTPPLMCRIILVLIMCKLDLLDLMNPFTWNYGPASTYPGNELFKSKRDEWLASLSSSITGSQKFERVMTQVSREKYEPQWTCPRYTCQRLATLKITYWMICIQFCGCYTQP